MYKIIFLLTFIFTGTTMAAVIPACAEKLSFEVKKKGRSFKDCYVLANKYVKLKFQHGIATMDVDIQISDSGKKLKKEPSKFCPDEVTLQAIPHELGYEFFSCRNQGMASFRIQLTPPHSDDVVPPNVTDYFVMGISSCIVYEDDGIFFCSDDS